MQLSEKFGLFDRITDPPALARTVERFRDRSIVLPTFAQLADPVEYPARRSRTRLASVDPDAHDPANLFRVHWFNDASRAGTTDVPGYLELPGELTGVDARILVLLGNRFPMIRAHKVLAAYACLAPRIVTGAFDPTRDRAIWPSTGNYARGGVAISRIMDCRGVAVLPEGMSRERFEWLEAWIAGPEDVIRTYRDRVQRQGDLRRLQRTGQGPDQRHPQPVLRVRKPPQPSFELRVPPSSGSSHAADGKRLAAFVAASGSAGTLGAGDYLKERLGLEDRGGRGPRMSDDALQRLRPAQHPGNRRQAHPPHPQRRRTPTMPSPSPTAPPTPCSCSSTLRPARSYLAERGLDPGLIDNLASPGPVVDLQRAGRHPDRPPPSARPRRRPARQSPRTAPRCTGRRSSGSSNATIPGASAEDQAEAAAGRYLTDGDTGDFLELGDVGRRRIFNLGYYTWVEQQGVAIRRLRAAARAGLLEGPPPSPRHLGRDDHRFQRASRCHGTEADSPNPFIRYRWLLDSYRKAIGQGWSDADFVSLVDRLDKAVAEVSGQGLRDDTPQPATRPGRRRRAADRPPCGSRTRPPTSGDPTRRGTYSGCLLHMEVEDETDGELAIASCGNAAVAAAVVARAAERPLRVFIPTWADPAVVTALDALEATIEVSERKKGEIGDPTVLRMLEAVERGAVPFSVQGTITPDTLDGGRTIGWELAEQLSRARVAGKVALFVQVGGGALAASTWRGLRDGIHQQWLDVDPILHTVQTEAAAPLNRAWRGLLSEMDRQPLLDHDDAIDLALGAAREDPDHFMWAWEEIGSTAATGIVDDVTYDWLPVVEAMLRSEGQAKVVSEEMITRANHLARIHTGIEVGHTGSAGLAGVLDPSLIEFLDRGQNVVVFFTGTDRHDR